MTLVVLLAAWVAFVDEPALDALLPDDFRHELEAYRLDPAGQVAARQAQAEARCRAWERDPHAFYREVFGDAADTLPGYWVLN